MCICIVYMRKEMKKPIGGENGFSSYIVLVTTRVGNVKLDSYIYIHIDTRLAQRRCSFSLDNDVLFLHLTCLKKISLFFF